MNTYDTPTDLKTAKREAKAHVVKHCKHPELAGTEISTQPDAPTCTPVLDSLWRRCFVEESERCKALGKDSVKFSDVDAIVLKKSKRGVQDLLEFLSSDAKKLVIK